MQTGCPDPTAAGRTAAGLALSGAAVVVPLSGAVAAVALARQLLVSGAAADEPGAALLALAAATLALVLAWATAAAVAGVRQGWQHARPPRGVPTAPPSGRDRRSDVVAAAVAAMVVAVLTAPAASASSVAAPRVAAHGPSHVSHGSSPVSHGPSPRAHEQPVGTDAAPAGVHHPVADEGASEPPADVPGSWSGLAGDGFRAPAGVSPGTASLVTGRPARPVEEAREVVVTAGDSLWAIAARHLGPDADDARVAEAWPAWWETNRATIGDDPDLLLPGQRLQVPTG